MGTFDRANELGYSSEFPSTSILVYVTTSVVGGIIGVVTWSISFIVLWDL